MENNKNKGVNDFGYRKIDDYSDEKTERLAALYKEALTLLGEDPTREGLAATPVRVAKAMQFFTQGYHQDPKAILRSALFVEDYKQMVIVKNIEI